VLAVRDKSNKRWVYAGHVGTGFDRTTLKSMQPLRADKRPFAQKVKQENATKWLVPKLMSEVKFTNGRVKARCAILSFLGCADKKANDVIREQA
jgi:bifunctional non-homologous end joining protein LigD